MRFNIMGSTALLVLGAASAWGLDRSVALPYDYSTENAPTQTKIVACPNGNPLKTDAAGKFVCGNEISKILLCQSKIKIYAPARATADADGCVGLTGQSATRTIKIADGFMSQAGSMNYAEEHRSVNLDTKVPVSMRSGFQLEATNWNAGGTSWRGGCPMFPRLAYGTPSNAYYSRCYTSSSNSKKYMDFFYNWDGNGNLSYGFNGRIMINMSDVTLVTQYMQVVPQ